MTVEQVTPERLPAFLTYCQTHRTVIDDSFLYDEDLRDFVPDDENPTYVAIGDTGRVVGAASVMNSAYYRRARTERFRIFHVENADPDIYAELLASVAMAVSGLDALYVFVPADNAEMRNLLDALHFRIERTACVMRRNPAPVPEPDWEEGYYLRAMVFNQDEADYCLVQNLGFAHLQGSETPITLDEVARIKDSADYIPSGVLLLYHHKEPVGVVRASRDVYEDQPVVSIGPLALVPGCRGQGLGRQLLRAALLVGRTQGLSTAILSANVDNEAATRLYASEGFRMVETVVCYTYPLPRQSRRTPAPPRK